MPKLLSRVLLSFLAVFLVLFGLKGPLLKRLGCETEATVTAVARRRRTASIERVEFTYAIAYRFRTPPAGR